MLCACRKSTLYCGTIAAYNVNFNCTNFLRFHIFQCLIHHYSSIKCQYILPNNLYLDLEKSYCEKTVLNRIMPVSLRHCFSTFTFQYNRMITIHSRQVSLVTCHACACRRCAASVVWIHGQVTGRLCGCVNCAVNIVRCVL